MRVAFSVSNLHTGVLIVNHTLAKPSRTCAWPLTLRNPPEPSGTSPNLPESLHLPPPPTLWNFLEPSSNFQNIQDSPEPASGTCTSTYRNFSGTCLRNLHQHLPELSGTCLWNLHHRSRQNLSEPSGTFRNLRLRPALAHAGVNLG